MRYNNELLAWKDYNVRKSPLAIEAIPKKNTRAISATEEEQKMFFRLKGVLQEPKIRILTDDVVVGLFDLQSSDKGMLGADISLPVAQNIQPVTATLRETQHGHTDQPPVAHGLPNCTVIAAIMEGYAITLQAQL